MGVITKIAVCEDIALITLKNSPADMKFISYVFKTLADKGINVDMISQTAPVSKHVSISFTISDEELGKAIELFAVIRTQYPAIKFDVSAGNGKISLYGEAMRDIPGVAAGVFEAIAGLGIDIGIITTSELDISLLVPKAHFAFAVETFEKHCGVKATMQPL